MKYLALSQNEIWLRTTKCTFHKFGNFGSIEKYESECLLPFNVFNEKIYIFLWFYFIILSGITLIFLLYLLVLKCCPSSKRSLLLREENTVKAVLGKVSFSDALLIYLITRNVNKDLYQKVLPQLSSFLDKNQNPSSA